MGRKANKVGSVRVTAVLSAEQGNMLSSMAEVGMLGKTAPEVLEGIVQREFLRMFELGLVSSTGRYIRKDE